MAWNTAMPPLRDDSHLYYLTIQKFGRDIVLIQVGLLWHFNNVSVKG